MSITYDPLHDCKMIGAIRAMQGMNDCYTIVHGRTGCHCGAIILQSMGSEQNSVRLLHSGIKGSDEVFSGEERLAASIKLADKTFSPKAIAVLNCSAPVIMGEDIKGLEFVLSNEISSELLTLDAGGFEGAAWIGYEQILSQLVSLMESCDDSMKSGVNILGFKSDDFCSRGDLNEIKRILKDQNIPVNTVLCGSSIEEIKRAPQAELNILLGGDGFLCAEGMRDKFGTPFLVVPYPYGLQKTIEFVEKICKALNHDVNYESLEKEKEYVKSIIERAHMYYQGIYSAPVAVIGESGRVFDLADFLCDELGLEVEVLALSARNYLTNDRVKREDLPCQNILIEPDRYELNQALDKARVSMIFGSTFEKKIADDLKASLVRISYPVLDQISLSDLPFAGFMGITHMSEYIINSMICRSREEVMV